MISKGLLLKKLLCLLLFISAVTSFKTILRTSVLQVGNKFHSQNYHTLRFDKSENHARNTVGGKNPSISYRIKNFIDGVFKPKEENQMSLMNLLWNGNSVKLRSYLVMAMAFMFFGKWFNLRVPFILQKAVDGISVNTVQATKSITVAFAMYGLARAFSVVCAEIKTCLFIHVSQNVLRKFGGQIFRHLHSLDSAFHLGTPSGVISVAYVRAIRGFQTMLFQLVFSVAPTILELVMVSHILMNRFGGIFAGITLTTFCAYLAFTVWITQWRIHLRQEMVEVDNKRNGFFIDSILNHEVVKLFTNENREFDKFDGYLGRMERLNIDSTIAVAVLNVGQAFMFSMGLVASLLVAFKRVQCGMMSVGDLVAVNSMLLQLAIPFNFMGYTCKIDYC